eukprot:gene8442-11420_t
MNSNGKIINALCGGFMEDDQSWKPFDGRLSVFFSSTFTDTHIERNILQKNVLSNLQMVARPNKIPIMLVDMRWGVKDESTLNHQTWIECSKEIERCRNESTNLFFVSLQSQKYGYRPLPYSISESDLEVRLGDITLSASNADLIRSWYILDRNADPPRYFLRHLTNISDDDFWKNVRPVMVEVLRGIPFEVCGGESFVVGQSVTEWEIRSAVLKNGGENLHGIHWLNRQFSEPLTKSDVKYWDYDDTLDDSKPQIRQGFVNLLDWMNRSGIETSHYNQSSYQDFVDEKDLWKSQLSRWETDVTNLLHRSLDEIIIRKNNWERDGDGFGLPGAILAEMLHHYKWAGIKCRTFFGRDELIDNITDRIYEPTRQVIDNSCYFAGVHFAIIGGSGCGKTSLIAKVASLVFQREKSAHRMRPVIIRFCGTSPGSQHGRQLVLSLCLQIAIICEGNVDLASLEKMSYDEIVAKLHSLLNSHPVILFLDSLDQLSNENLARSHLTFLKNVKPHPNTRIIVSALPDDKSDGLVRYYYGCETKLESDGVSMCTVEKLDEPMIILKSLLKAKSRRLLPSEQIDIVYKQLIVEPTALYVRLASEIVCTWRSTFRPTAEDLPGGMIGIIQFLFNKFSVDYGPVLTKVAFGFLTYSLEGVSDDEMCDLLSLSEEVMNETIHHNTDHVVPTHRVPNHVWLRLRSSIASLVTEQSGGCLKWYHRQLKEVAESWAVDQKQLCHEIMGRYFSDIVPVNIRVERYISSQPLLLNNQPSECVILCDTSVINHRRCQEGAHHLLSAGLTEEAEFELCSMTAVAARGRIGIIFQYLNELGRLQKLLPLLRRANHYCRWIMHDAHILSQSPISLGCCTSQPFISLVRKDFDDLCNCFEKCPIGTMGTWSVGRVLGGWADFLPELNLLLGHEELVTTACFSPDKSKIASSSYDKTIRIWNSFTGQLLNTLEGYSSSSVAFNYDGSQVVSGSNDSSVIIWDITTGKVIKKLVVSHSSNVRSVCFNYDGSRVVSGSSGGIIRIWDVITGHVIHELVGHSDHVNSVSFSYDGNRIVSGSDDNTIRIWDVVTGKIIFELVGHSNHVNSVCFNHDGSRIVSGSNDDTIRIWDAITGRIIHDLVSHSWGVISVAFNHNGSRIVSGSYDNIVRIWDAITVQVINELVGHSDKINSVNFNYDGSRIVSCSEDKTVRIWDATVGKTINELVGQSKRVTSIAFNYDGTRVVSGSYDRIVRIWDVIANQVINELVGHSFSVNSVCFNHDGSRVVSGSSDDTIRVWDVITGHVIHELVGHSAGVESVSFNYDGSRIVSGSYDDTIRIWDAITGKVIHELVGHSSEVNSVCFNYDGSRVVSVVKELAGHLYSVRSVAFNHDGSRIVSGSDDMTVRIWDVTTGEVINEFGNISSSVNSVCFNYDGSRVVSGSNDTIVRIWDVVTGQIINELVGHSSSVSSVCFNYDGSRILSGSFDKTVRIWDGQHCLV